MPSVRRQKMSLRNSLLTYLKDCTVCEASHVDCFHSLTGHTPCTHFDFNIDAGALFSGARQIQSRDKSFISTGLDINISRLSSTTAGCHQHQPMIHPMPCLPPPIDSSKAQVAVPWSNYRPVLTFTNVNQKRGRNYSAPFLTHDPIKTTPPITPPVADYSAGAGAARSGACVSHGGWLINTFVTAMYSGRPAGRSAGWPSGRPSSQF